MGLIILVIVIALVGIGLTGYLIFLGDKEELSHDQLKPKSAVSQTQFVRLGTPPEPKESWNLGSIINEFNNTKQSISELDQSQEKPERAEGLKSYFAYLRGVLYMIICGDKDIIAFALLQWSSIAVGYYLWVQMLSWIPAEVWRSAEHSRHASLVDLILIAWSFVCVGIAALPLGIFCPYRVVYFLRRQGYPGTMAACLSIVLPEVWPLWIFTWVDGWITVNQILERLPKKNDHETFAQKALSEALYFAWKLGTIGILPALITGRGLVESCRDSISVVKAKFVDAAKLRLVRFIYVGLLV